MSPSPPSRREVFTAMLEGIHAGRAGRPATDCPYNPNGDRAEQIKTRFWLKGWLKNRPRPLIPRQYLDP